MIFTLGGRGRGLCRGKSLIGAAEIAGNLIKVVKKCVKCYEPFFRDERAGGGGGSMAVTRAVIFAVFSAGEPEF